MQLLNETLLAALKKVTTAITDQVEGAVNLDGRSLTISGQLTAAEVKAVIDTIKTLPFMTEKNRRIIISDFNQAFERPEDAYKFMRLVITLKNKFNTPIWHLSPFGNFSSLHYQGNVDFAVIPEDKKAGKAESKKEEAPKVAKTEAKKEVKAEAPKRAPRKTAAKTETKTATKRTTRKRK